MNSHTTRALFKDAFYQVLDNKVFRLLVIVCICPIAFTFLVAFKPDEISVLFGWKTIAYSDIGFTGAGVAATGGNANVRIIQGLQSLFTAGFAGNVGILLSLAATAFFVPRMLQKGEADTLFSKPVGRFVLLFARYLAGVLFVAVLAFVLVLGMHLGFLLCSGYSDPGFLWGALTLVYVFAMIHAFSTAVGVVTRSSVAALLLAILLFWCNGCVQTLWVGKEYTIEVARVQSTESDDEQSAKAKEAFDSPAAKAIVAVLDGLHYVLPKTHDADVLTKKLRTVVAGPDYVVLDPEGQLAIAQAPKDLERKGSGFEVDMSREPVVWTASEQGQEVARITVQRQSRMVERKAGDKVRSVRTSASAAAAEFLKTLEGRSDLDGRPTRERVQGEGPARDRVSWTEKRSDSRFARERVFFAIDDWMFTVDGDFDSAWMSRDDHDQVMTEFLATLKPQRNSAVDLTPMDWYERQFGWNAPLRFNAFFSIASSVAFALLMMLVARWRLARIDF